MPFCSNCGAEMPDDANFCSSCGQLTSKGEEGNVEYPQLARRTWWGSGPKYVVDEERTFEGAVTLGKVSFGAENVNGPIKVSTWEKDEYKVDTFIEAGGYTVEEAKRNLADLDVRVEDEAQGDTQRLKLVINRPVDAARWFAIEINVSLPEKAETDLDLRSRNGGIGVERVHGGKVAVETRNGRVSLKEIVAGDIYCESRNGKLALEKVSAAKLTAKTSNGRIEGALESEDALISTSNGKIDLDLPCTIDGDYELRTSNGSIDLNVPRSQDIGYDLDLRTSMGRVSSDLPDLEFDRVDRRRKTARTRGYADKAVKVAIEARTSMGSIRIN